MYVYYFILAFTVRLALTFLVFFSDPKSWQKNRILKIILLIQHSLGSLALGIVFICYKDVPYEWMKWIVSRWATIYQVTIIMLAAFFFIRLIISKCYHLIRKNSGYEKKRVITDKKLHSVVFIVLSYVISVIGFINIGQIHSTTYDVTINKPSSVKELKIAFIADIHAGAGTWKYSYEDLTEALENADPDILLIGGDLFDETTSKQDVEYVKAVIRQMNPQYGIYFVFGNHDNYKDERTANVLEELGVTILRDETVTIDGAIQLIGRMDPVADTLDIDELIKKEDIDMGKPVIVLQHRPIEYQKLADAGCDLVMSGHTHGFNIPQFAGNVTRFDMLQGIKKYGDMTAIVTSGVSAWGFHYKWPAKSEVVNIRLSFE